MIHPLNQWVLHSCSSMPLKSLQTRIILFLFPSPATAHNSINLIAWSGSMRFPPYLVLPIWPRHLLAPKICLQCQEAKTTPYHQIGDLIPLGGGGWASCAPPLPFLISWVKGQALLPTAKFILPHKSFDPPSLPQDHAMWLMFLIGNSFSNGLYKVLSEL